MSVNPYEPMALSEKTLSSGDRLIFDGVIEATDYSSLLPNRTLVRWMQYGIVLLLLPLTLVGILALPIGLATSRIPGDRLVAFSVFTMLFSIFLSLWVGVWSMSPRQRSRRLLRRYPDLIGAAQGEFNASGLMFHDGMRQHWFGPSILAHAIVSRAGIRTPVDSSPYRYLAITSRLFDHFDLDTALKFQATWLRLSAIAEKSIVDEARSVWDVAAQTPANAVSFKGYLTTRVPMKSIEVKQTAAIHTVSAVIFIMVAFYWNDLSPYLLWAFIGLGVMSALSMINLWHQYYYQVRELTTYQYGWVNAKNLVFCSNEKGLCIARDEVTNVHSTDSAMRIETKASGQFWIFRDHVQSDLEWQDLHTLFAVEVKRDCRIPKQ